MQIREQLITARSGLTNPLHTCAHEAGEVAGKIKKIFRDQNGQIIEDDRQSLKSELGDVLWCLTQICAELGLTLEEVAETNITKLSSRKERDKLGEMAIIDRTDQRG